MTVSDPAGNTPLIRGPFALRYPLLRGLPDRIDHHCRGSTRPWCQLQLGLAGCYWPRADPSWCFAMRRDVRIGPLHEWAKKSQSNVPASMQLLLDKSREQPARELGKPLGDDHRGTDVSKQPTNAAPRNRKDCC